ncbi:MULTISPECIES: cysteine-rich CWC family protein [Paenibacillus]|nr:cysteine-rich CWC family protein [Paenibacillus alvei]
MRMTTEINPKICPLCGNDNQCAYQAGRPPQECWCMNISVPKALLEKIPSELRRKACVCKRCVQQFLQSEGN